MYLLKYFKVFLCFIQLFYFGLDIATLRCYTSIFDGFIPNSIMCESIKNWMSTGSHQCSDVMNDGTPQCAQCQGTNIAFSCSSNVML